MLSFVLAVLATWRVTHLLAHEDGPADLIFRFRRLLGQSLAGLHRYDEAEPILVSSYQALLAQASSIPSENRVVIERIRGFIIELTVWDTSICPSLAGDHHEIDYAFPFCICNDLPAPTGA